MRIRRKYPERTEIFTTVGMVLTFVTLRSKIHTLCQHAVAVLYIKHGLSIVTCFLGGVGVVVAKKQAL